MGFLIFERTENINTQAYNNIVGIFNKSISYGDTNAKVWHQFAMINYLSIDLEGTPNYNNIIFAVEGFIKSVN
jgi:hypothetical protein